MAFVDKVQAEPWEWRPRKTEEKKELRPGCGTLKLAGGAAGEKWSSRRNGSNEGEGQCQVFCRRQGATALGRRVERPKRKNSSPSPHLRSGV